MILGQYPSNGNIPRMAISLECTITGNSFRFYRDTNFWFETAITLPGHYTARPLHCPAITLPSE